MATLDSKFQFRDVVLVNDDPTQLNDDDEYTVFSAKRAFKQRFAFDLTLRSSDEDLGMEFYAAMVESGGRGGLIQWPNPMKKRGLAPNNVVCRAVNAVGQGQRSILLQGFAANFDQPMKVGEFIRPFNNYKAYMLTSVGPVDGNGRTTVGIYPALYHAVSGNEVIQISNQVVLNVRLESDVNDILLAASSGGRVSPRISIVEGN